MTEAAYWLPYLLQRVARLRHRWARRRAVEQLAHRLGASRRQSDLIAHHTP